jgi:hypothetical protein
MFAIEERQATNLHLLVACLAYSLILKMAAVRFSEMSVSFYQTTWSHVPEYGNLHSDRRDNPNSAHCRN